MLGDDTLTCLATGTWNRLSPICTPFCTPLIRPFNGGIYPSLCTNSSAIRPGSRCFYYCDSNYILDGSSVTCSSNGQWKGIIPLCKKTCAPLSRPDHGVVLPTHCTEHRVPVDFICSFDCDDGYAVSGNPSLTCDVNGRWNSPQPTCRKGCSLLQLPANGMINPPSCSSNNINSGEVVEGIVCIYSCNDGYLLHGNSQRMCGEGGIWTGKQPECKRICGRISIPPNMNVQPQSCKNEISVEGMQCDFICDDQYDIFGETSSITCLGDGNWSIPDAVCYRTCSSLPQVFNGEIRPGLCVNSERAIPEGTDCEVHCSDGFFILGNSQVSCSHQGYWSGNVGKCLKKCERVLTPDFGMVSPINCSLDEVFEGTQCHFSCKEKYSLKGTSEIITCLGDGSWEGSVPECISEDRIMIIQESQYYQVCIIGNIFGAITVAQLDECPYLPDTQWWIPTIHGQFLNLALGKCARKNGLVLELSECDSSDVNQKFIWVEEEGFQSFSLNPEFHNGYMSFPYISPSSSYNQVKLHLEKRTEFTSWYPVSSNDILSLYGGSDKGNCPTLRPSTSIVNPPNCTNDLNVMNGTVCNFTCHAGYKLYGPSNRTCLNGHWDKKYPTCRRACFPLTEPLKGSVTVSCKDDLQDQGTVCLYECIDEQHQLYGEAVTTCLPQGHWSSPTPVCKELCQPLSKVLHGIVQPTNCLEIASSVGTDCNLKCTFPYLLQGVANRTCMEDHSWTGDWMCIRGCNVPSQIDNGFVTCDTESVYEGTACSYNCDNGYHFSNYLDDDTVIRICQSNGLLNGSIPQCKMVCPPLSGIQNGEISPENCTSASVFEGEICKITCDMGYRFKGEMSDVMCLSDGTWQTTEYLCEEEVQFVLFNDVTVPQVCGRMDETVVGSLMKKLELSHYNCHYLMSKTLWTWEGDMLKHVVSGLCLAVQDMSTQSFSLVLLRVCDEDDLSLQWTCEHEYMLRLSSKPLYMSASSTDNLFIIVKDNKDSAIKLDFMWKSTPVNNQSDTGGPCKTKLKRCHEFDALEHGSITPSVCNFESQYDGFVCNISCDEGYLIYKTALQTISVSCQAYGAWRATVPLAVDALPPICRKSCPALTIPARGNIDPVSPCVNGTSLYGAVCHFNCDYMNVLEGPEVLVCGIDGTWSEPPPLCRAICIHQAMKPGSHAGSPIIEYPSIYGCVDKIHYARSVREGSTCYYHCTGGMHVLNGTESRTCQASGQSKITGQFDQPLPDCVFPTAGNLSHDSISDCPHPPGNPSNVYLCLLDDSDPTTTRLCANYTCDPDSVLVGDSISHCNIVNSSWPSPPVCKRRCKDISNECKDMYDGEVCYYRCKYGSFAHGNGILLCRSDGTWNDTVPACIVQEEFYIQTRISVSPLINDYCLLPNTFGAPYINSAVVVEECGGQVRARWIWLNNYNIMHAPSALCLTAPLVKHGARLFLAICDPLDIRQQWDCSTNLEKPFIVLSKANPTLVLATTRALKEYGLHYYYACIVDLSLLDKKNLRSTNWNTDIFDAKGTICHHRLNQANCPPLKSGLPSGGNVSPASCLEEWSPKGRSCLWFCTSGYQLTSPNYTAIECNNGLWNPMTISCPRSCAPLNHPSNGLLIDCAPNMIPVEGTTCNIECDENCYPIGETARICQWDGSWSGSAFKCAKSCSVLPLMSNIIILPTTCTDENEASVAGTTCTYSCGNGYHMASKEITRTCLEDGTWSGVEPTCIRVCPHLPEVLNGKVSPVKCSTADQSAGSVCIIHCNFGYVVNGNNTHECKVDGTWTNSVEISDGKKVCQSQCKPLVRPKHGEIVCKVNDLELSHHQGLYVETTICRIYCDRGYVIDGSWMRVCEESGLWSGDNTYCYKEQQFLMFLSKPLHNTNGQSIKVCMISKQDNTIMKLNNEECDASNPFHRWSWYHEKNLKNSGSGYCLSAVSPGAGLQLEMTKCNVTDDIQHWSCKGPSPDDIWFLRMSSYNLYLDYGYSTVSSIWLHDLDLYNNEEEDIVWHAESTSDEWSTSNGKSSRTTICSMKSKTIGGTCNPLQPISDGEIYPRICIGPDKFVVAGLMCLYECNVGFQSNTPLNTVVCQDNGVWSGPPTSCQRYCSQFKVMPNMIVHPSSCFVIDEEESLEDEVDKKGIPISGVCVFTCQDGYTLGDTGEFTSSCMDSGVWSRHPPECKRICSNISPMSHAFASPASCFTEEQTEGAICRLECEIGFGIDIVDVSCYNDGLNNNENSTALVNRCKTKKEQSSTLIGSVTKLCMADGTWSGEEVECISMCNPVVAPRNGQVMPLSCSENFVKEGSTCSFICDEGFVVSGSSSKVCKAGVWILPSSLSKEENDEDDFVVSAEPPSCERYCVSPTQTNNFTFITPATCIMKKISIGTVCTTSCDSEHILVGEALSTCLLDGTWDNIPAKCIEKCSALKPLEDGKVFPHVCTMTSMGSGAVCAFSCFDQYTLIGSVTTTCNATGIWSTPMPECKRRCFPLTKIYNGEASPPNSCNSNHITAGETCSFSCNDGFTLVGSSSATCGEDGQWDNTVPRCNKQCPVPKIENGTLNCTTVDLKQIQGRNVMDYVWGTKCKVVCNRELSASSVAVVTCNSRGQWYPDFPECIETGVPMYIMQSLDGNSICLTENEIGEIEKLDKQSCLKTSLDGTTSHQWRWLQNYNIQNSATGRCIAVYNVRSDEPLITRPCDTEDPLQWWECSTHNPFRLLLRDTAYSPSTYIKNSAKVVLQLWSDAHSYFSTLSLRTITLSSLCSRRPGGACPPLYDIPGGIVDPPEKCKTIAVEEGEICTFDCISETAYVLGDAFTLCMGNGLWMNPIPTCVESCPQLMDTLPGNTYYEDPDCVFDEPHVDQICIAKCLKGYEMRGNPERKCLANGEWSPLRFQCRRICPVIFGILDGKIDPLPCRSVSCTFRCNPGHVLSGPKVLMCLDSGEWDKRIPQCIRDDQFQIISMAVKSQSLCVTVEEDNLIAKHKCMSTDASQLFKWKTNSDLLQHVESGLCVTGSGSKWGKITLQDCDSTNSFQLWDCGSSPHSDINSLRISVGGETYYLDVGAEEDGHSLSEKIIRHRLVMETQYHFSSHWIAKHYFSEGTVCSMKDIKQCPQFVVSKHGKVSPDDCKDHTKVKEGLVCHVSCDVGFSSEATTHSTCLQGGKWTSPMPVCKDDYKCDKLVLSTPGVEVSPTSCTEDPVNEGEICYFSCAQGFSLSGSKSVKCLNGGIWSNNPPTCLQTCGPLLLPDNGWVSPSWCLGHNNIAETECSFQCEAGYHLSGSSLRKCKPSGVWDGVDTKCTKYCKNLRAPNNGIVYPTRCKTDDNYEENVCQFQCESGYVLSGASSLVCSNGNWSHPLPSCIRLNACPLISSTRDCPMNIVYHDLYKDEAVIPGSQVSVICGAGCSLVSGPVSRSCNSDNKWDGGLPVCEKQCPAFMSEMGVLVKPSSCGQLWQPKGTKCTLTCVAGMVSEDEIAGVECTDNGKWSEINFSCQNEDGRGNESVSNPFLIRQRYSNDVHICLQASVTNEYVVQASAASCSKINLSQLWTWFNYKLIRSVSSNLCWSPMRRDGGILLGLAKCDLEDSGQVFTCGDTELQQYMLHIVTEKMEVWNSGSSVIQLTALPVDQGLDWEAVEVDSMDMFKSNNNMSLQNSVCRQMCGGVLSSDSGVFSSPGFPLKYRLNILCDWTIIAPGKKIYLWLHNVDIGKSKPNEYGRCTEDSLVIVDGDDSSLENSNVLGRICGQWKTTLGPFISMNGKMLIRFFSNNDFVATGFSATWDTEQLPEKLADCASVAGKKKGRLVGGTETEVSSVPWHASLISLQGQQHLCGATFVHSQYLITAAHCVSDLTKESMSDVIVGYGGSSLRILLNLIHVFTAQNTDNKQSMNTSDGATLVRIKNIHVHPEFDDNMNNDIAVIKIAVKSTLDASVACLPYPHVVSDSSNFGRIEIAKQYCRVAGWDAEGNGGIQPLHSIELPVLSDDHCDALSTTSFGRTINTTSIICAGHFDGTQQTLCDGDDGSSLVCEWNGNNYVVGVASFQVAPCGKLNVPKYFARVAAHKEWILHNFIS
ncbi:uncharacterized protein LOC120340508 [Styela clava]